MYLLMLSIAPYLIISKNNLNHHHNRYKSEAFSHYNIL